MGRNQRETDHGVYWPDRLTVTTTPPTRFIGTRSIIRRPPYDDNTRVFIHDDVIQSFWSDYANTVDHCY